MVRSAGQCEGTGPAGRGGATSPALLSRALTLGLRPLSHRLQGVAGRGRDHFSGGEVGGPEVRAAQPPLRVRRGQAPWQPRPTVWGGQVLGQARADRAACPRCREQPLPGSSARAGPCSRARALEQPQRHHGAVLPVDGYRQLPAARGRPPGHPAAVR